MIAAENASLVYLDHGREIYACRDLNITVESGEFIGVLGPSGSGKSSLLYLLSGLKNPTQGRILYDGSPLSELDDAPRATMRLRNFGFVFQQPFLLNYLTSLENVLLPNPSRKDAAARAEELLLSLGLGDKMHRFPSELSGGEKQRVCAARALFNEPAVIFADEPTASLDHATGKAVVDLISENRGGALIMVTHDPSMLARADRVYEMDSGVARELAADEWNRIIASHPNLLLG